MVVAGLQGPYGGTGNFGNLFVGQVVKIFHIKNQALLIGQGKQGLLQFFLNVIA